MELDKSASIEIEELKRKVKEIIGEVNNLKTQLKEGKVSLEDFRKKKNLLEEELREILEKISKFKDKGTPEMKMDAIIAGEANQLMCNFQTDFLENMSKAKVYISVSLDDHFTFDIDYSNYPEKPNLLIPKEIKKLFVLPLIRQITCLDDWNPEKPSHILDIFNELEGLLLSKFQGTFSDLENIQA